MRSELSVVVVSWNSAHEILSCLGSLPKGAAGPELWVVDNASNDATVELVSRHFPHAKLIVNDHNRGFAAACNQALEQTREHHALLLNPDTVVKAGALEHLLRHLEEHSEVGVLGPRLVDVDGSPQPSCTRYPSLWSNVLGHFAGGGYLPRRTGGATAVSAVSGAAMMVRRDAMDRVGLLDTDYFMYGEDTDWCYRIRGAGWMIHYLPTAEIMHLKGASASRVPAESAVRRRMGRLIFVRKHRGSLHFRLLAAAMRWNLERQRAGARGADRRHWTRVLELFEEALRSHG